MKEELSVVLAGEAGQGIKTAELMMVEILKKQKYFFFISREYMSRVRGGINTTQILISDKPVNSFSARTDLMVALTGGVRERYNHRIDEDTLFVENKDFIEIAKKNGNVKYANSVLFGYLCSCIGAPGEQGVEIIKSTYSDKPDTIEGNVSSFNEGYELYKGERKKFKANKEDFLTVDVSRAVAYGAIFGGCDFIASYPMSPSTAVLTNLAELSGEYSILLEQAEDEIAAINMALGASYAGARAMVTTSGGGFALMSEGISLAGGAEIPVVVHIGQRPGPATGLPTRTEQGDLNLALYAGHGEFQRVIYAPGDQLQAIGITMKAFDTADRYQIPVIILTDQFLLDSVKPVPKQSIALPEALRHTIKTEEGYKRYRITEDGISPRGIPGYGNGTVCVDSDEHDEEGRITEDRDIRKQMVEKRNKRGEALKAESMMPAPIGEQEYDTIVVCYGSNLGIALDLKEECEKLDCAFLHFSQLHPLNDKVKQYFEKAKRTVIIENNFGGQFADLLESRFHITIDQRILKYDGDPFSREEILDRLKEAIS